MSQKRYTMEVCCYNLESAFAAQSSGADRIELCENRHEGGTTPSYGMLETVKKHLTIPISVMIRPRGGDFLYTREELEVMIYDIQMAKELGMDGVVLGVLHKDGTVDLTVMHELVDLARPMKVTFHRAFDLTPDPLKALERLMVLQVDRLLTSGQCASALDGKDLIKNLVIEAKNQLSIMPGGGIREDHLKSLLRYTGAREFHISARGTRPSRMEFRSPGVSMGTKVNEYEMEVADPQRLKAFRELAQ